MILSKKKIIKELKKGKINLSPFNNEALNPTSYTFSLGFEINEVISNTLDVKKRTKLKSIRIPHSGLKLYPGKLYLANTYEEIGSNHYVITLIGVKEIEKLGLFVHITADMGHLGTNHCWTLEIKVIQPLIIYPGMEIGRIIFWKPQGSLDMKYDGRYAKYNKPHESEIYKEFN